MNKTPSFIKTLVPSNCKMQSAVWDNVRELYANGKYKECLLRLLDYIDPDLANRCGNADKTEFNIPHGSVVVNFKIDGDKVKVIAPFLKLPEKNQIPMLRQIAEINFYPLTLAHIVLEGEQLVFKYETSLNLCEPYKMYYLFREICIYADNYDDEFIQKFGAKRFQEPKIKNFAPDQVNAINNTFQIYLKEANDYMAYFESSRLSGFIWDTLIQTFFKIDYFVAPQGALRTEIENVINYMQNSQYSIHEKIEKGKTFLKRLQTLSPTELADNLYIADLFIPVKYIANLQNVQDHFAKQYETAKREMASNDYMGASLSIQYMFLYEFYYYYPPVEVVTVMNDAMIATSNMAWNEAAPILWTAMDNIMEGNFSKKEENLNDVINNYTKGFLNKFFGQ